MTPQQPPTKLQLTNSADYRESYANSVQVRVSLWDFFLLFGTITQTGPDAVTILNHQGVYLSPQQAKALANAAVGDTLNVLNTASKKQIEVVATGPDQAVVGPEALRLKADRNPAQIASR